MAICNFCKQEMKEADSCIKIFIISDGRQYKPLRTKFDKINKRCLGCGVKHGAYHHPGCGEEICPRCGDKIISCKCLNIKEKENK